MAESFLTVNGKKIIADIADFNEAEGWVDIILPELSTTQVISSATKGIPDPNNAPELKTRVKRLTGEVRIVTR